MIFAAIHWAQYMKIWLWLALIYAVHIWNLVSLCHRVCVVWIFFTGGSVVSGVAYSSSLEGSERLLIPEFALVEALASYDPCGVTSMEWKQQQRQQQQQQHTEWTHTMSHVHLLRCKHSHFPFFSTGSVNDVLPVSHNNPADWHWTCTAES